MHRFIGGLMRTVGGVLAILMLAAVSHAATTGEGLQVKVAPVTWQAWQARLVVNLPSLGWLSTAPNSSGTAIAGDHFFEWGRSGESGGFRATGAVMWGSNGGAPLPNAWPDHFKLDGAARREGLESTAMPYLGMGYSAAWPRQGLGLSADVGLLAQRPGSAKIGRLLSGTERIDDFARATQMAPVFQVQLSYAF